MADIAAASNDPIVSNSVVTHDDGLMPYDAIVNRQTFRVGYRFGTHKGRSGDSPSPLLADTVHA